MLVLLLNLTWPSSCDSSSIVSSSVGRLFLPLFLQTCMQVRPKYAQGARSVPGTIADVPEGQPGTEQVPEHPSWDLAQSRCPQHLPQGLGQVLPYDSFSPLIHNLEIGCQNLRGFVSNPDVTLKERLLLLNCWTRGKEVGYFEHAHTAKTHPPPQCGVLLRSNRARGSFPASCLQPGVHLTCGLGFLRSR